MSKGRRSFIHVFFLYTRLIKGIMFDSARNLNPDAAKAYEEVEKYIDGEIAKCMRSEGSKTKDDSKHV